MSRNLLEIESIDLFESVPVSLWLQDFSCVKQAIEQIQASGIEDFDAHLSANPHLVASLAQHIRVVDVNQQTIELFKASSKEALFGRLQIDHPSFLAILQAQFVAVAQGRTQCQGEVMTFTHKGDPLHLLARWSVARGHEARYDKVLVSLIDLTAQKQVEKTIQEGEQRYRSLFAENHAAFLLIRPRTGEIVDANSAACTFYGYTHTQITEMQITQINVLPADKVKEEMQLAVKQHRKHFYFRHRLACGEIRDVEVYTSPIVVEGEELLYSLVHDITDRRQRERELEAISAMSQALQQTTTRSELLAGLMEQVLTLLHADSAALVRKDTDRNEAVIELGTGEIRTLRGHRMPLNVGMNGRVLSTGRPYVSRNLRNDPYFFPLKPIQHLRAAACVPVMIEDETIATIWVGRDTVFNDGDVRVLQVIAGMAAAALQRAELLAQLQTQAQQLGQILESIDDGLVLLDAQHRVVQANAAAQSYLRLLAGETWRAEPLRKLAAVPLACCLQQTSGSPCREIATEDPVSRIFAVAGHPLTDRRPPTERRTTDFTEDTGWVLVLRDVTRDRRHEQHLQSQQRLATVGQLAAGIAHDFNNILLVMTLYINMLQSQPDHPRRDHILHTLHEQADHAAKLIRQILDFSRRSILEQRPLEFAGFMQETIKLIERTLSEDIQLSFSYAPFSYPINGDHTHLQQALMNLTLNARDAMPNGGSLTFDLSPLVLYADEPTPLPEMETGAWLRFTIADTGAGIADKDLPHVFEPFFTTKETGKGTGLGLAQVYGIIKQHGGHIAVNSEPGVGTAFTIYLPLMPTQHDSFLTLTQVAFR